MRVLMVDIDTLRPDHMSCYGYFRRTTPHFDAVAKEGLRFQNYYCSDAPCLPSRAALVSGQFGIHNGVVGHGGTTADPILTGPQRGFRDVRAQHGFHNLFRRAGMHTVSFSSFAERHSAYWFDAGFNEIWNVGQGGMESAEAVIPAALDWLRRNAQQKDWFMHVHLWDPHTPYRAPESFGNPFAGQPVPAWITQEVFEEHLKHVGPHSANEIGMYDDREDPRFPRHPGRISTLEEVRRVMDGYDCGVAYADAQIGLLFDEMKRSGIYDDTAVIITSDHGEDLGELGIYGEHGTADDMTCRIPMIIKWPGGPKDQVEKGFWYNLDLVPTMAELLGLPACPEWDGRSYAAALRGQAAAGREYLVLSQMAHVCQRSVRWGSYLYIRTYHDGYHLFPKEMLFDLGADPHEQHDLSEEKPQICDRMARMLLDWHDEMMASSASVTDPLWTVMKENGPFHTWGALDAYLERLEQTGRGEGAKRLREKYR